MNVWSLFFKFFLGIGIVSMLFLAPLQAPVTVGTAVAPYAFSIVSEVHAADTTDPIFNPKVSLLDLIFKQMQGVMSFTAQAIQAVLEVNPQKVSGGFDTPLGTLSVTGNQRAGIADFNIPKLPDTNSGSLLVNVPFIGTSDFTVQGLSNFASATIHNFLTVAGETKIDSLLVTHKTQVQNITIQGVATVNQMSVTGNSILNTLAVSSDAHINGTLFAQGGIKTEGGDVDLAEGNLYASNVINSITAGSNITITGTANDLIISSARSKSSHPDLATVRAQGGCSECLTDSDIVSALTISGGLINGTTIGLTTAAAGRFTNVTVGTSTATSTLEVNGALVLNGSLTVVSTATSTFDGSINVTNGCVAVNGVCLGGGVSQLNDLSDVTTSLPAAGEVLVFDGSNWGNVATSTLGFGDGSFLSLNDTPSAYLAQAISYVNATGSALTQSANFVFDGTRLGIGTSSPLDTLSVAGAVGVLGQQALRFYNAANTNYVGFRASSSVSSDTLWSLPVSDGASDEILVTDGFGNLRFSSVGSVGGGSATYLGLSDTPSAFVSKSIPYVATSSLAFSSGFVFDGTNLGIGTSDPTSELSVLGSVNFRSATATPGFSYDKTTNRVGIGTANPTKLLSVEGGSISQRGGSAGAQYTPTLVGELDLPDNANGVQIVGQYAYVVTTSAGNDFHVIDISNSASPVVVGSLNLSASAYAVYVSGSYAYVVTNVVGDDLHIIDISNPASPVEVGSINLVTGGTDVFVQGRYAYVTTSGSGDDLHIIDVSNPSLPLEVGSVNLATAAYSVSVSGTYAYVGTDSTSNGFYVVDVSNPATPTQVGSAVIAESVNDVSVQGHYAYLAVSGASNHFRIVDISNPTAPVVVSQMNLDSTAYGVQVSGNYVYLSTAGTLDDFHVVDVSTPASPVEVGSINLSAGSGLGVAVSGRYGYMVTSSVGNDFHIFDITGVDVQSAFVNSLQSGSFSSLGDMKIVGNALLSKGLRVGLGGVQTDGALYVQGGATSFIKNKLGIGTTTPTHALTVGGDVQITGSIYDSTGSAGLNGYILQSTATGQKWIATSTLGFSPVFTTSAELSAILSDETGSAGSLVFSSSPTFSGTITAATANFAGNVGIGTTTPSQRLSVTGTIQSTDLQGGVTNLTTDAQGNIIRDPSDVRLKKSIVTLEDSLNKVLSLRGVSYQWIDDKRFGGQTEIGFIAQEVDLILPEVVRKGGDYWSINTRNILAVVVEGFKEMWKTVQGNQEQIQLLQERVSALELEAGISDTETPPPEFVMEVPSIIPETAPVIEVEDSATSTDSEFEVLPEVIVSSEELPIEIKTESADDSVVVQGTELVPNPAVVE